MAKIQTKTVKLSEIHLNPDNPRTITGKAMANLTKSLKEFPEMLELREIVVDESMMVLGGNMRLRALQKSGAVECVAKIVTGLTDKQKREFVIKDNAGFGEWDMDALANSCSDLPLSDWGIDIPFGGEDPDLEKYTRNIEAPIYTPTGEKPEIKTLFDNTKTKELISDIDSSNLSEDVKAFLVISAQRHTILNYKLIAEYYSHADKDTQKLMEDSALIIIDFNRAIELGYVKLSQDIAKLYEEDYGD